MMNSHNKYICDFCKTACVIRHESNWIDKNTRWHICPNCSTIQGMQVLYAVKPSGKASALMFTIPHDKNYYQVLIHFKNKTTEINYLNNYHFTKGSKEQTAYEVNKLLSFSFCMNTFTPINVKDKIKLLLLLS